MYAKCSTKCFNEKRKHIFIFFFFARDELSPYLCTFEIIIFKKKMIYRGFMMLKLEEIGQVSLIIVGMILNLVLLYYI